MIQNNLRTPQLAGFARQLGCKKAGSVIFCLVSFSIHCKHSCPETGSRKMADAINQSLEDMKELYCHELAELV